jgi:hypothetical protein
MDSLPYYERHPDDRARHAPTWDKDIDRLVRLDGWTWESLEQLIRWIIADEGDGSGWGGWKANCASPAKLRSRQRGSGRLYFEVVREQMERGVGKKRPAKADVGPLPVTILHGGGRVTEGPHEEMRREDARRREENRREAEAEARAEEDDDVPF